MVDDDEAFFIEDDKPELKAFLKDFDSQDSDDSYGNEFKDDKGNSVTINLIKTKRDNLIEVLLEGSKSFIEKSRKELLKKK